MPDTGNWFIYSTNIYGHNVIKKKKRLNRYFLVCTFHLCGEDQETVLQCAKCSGQIQLTLNHTGVRVAGLSSPAVKNS